MAKKVKEIKVTPKKATVKKPAVKKAPVKKDAPKKTAVKKAAVKKTVIKKPAPKKAVVKKAAPKKAAAKKPVVLKKLKPTTKPVLKKAPGIIPIEALIEKVITEDPLRSFDKHVFSKATAKGDPHNKLHLNTKSKRAKMPSAKKPMWRK